MTLSSPLIKIGAVPPRPSVPGHGPLPEPRSARQRRAEPFPPCGREHHFRASMLRRRRGRAAGRRGLVWHGTWTVGQYLVLDRRRLCEGRQQPLSAPKVSGYLARAWSAQRRV